MRPNLRAFVVAIATVVTLATGIARQTAGSEAGSKPDPTRPLGIIGLREVGVLDAEPGLPIAFVVTNAFTGTVLNLRKHVIHMPRPGRAPREA